MKNLFQKPFKILFLTVLFIALSQIAIANTVTKNYPVNEFSKLQVSSAFQVEFIHSNENKVVVEIDESAAGNVVVENNGKELKIMLKENTGNTTKTMKATVYGNTLTGIFLSGASDFKSDYIFNEKEMSIKSSGASKIELTLKTDNLNMDLSGASKVTVNGSSEKQVADVSGASVYFGKNCKSVNSFISASGASKATVNCMDTLDAQASGASYINCITTPKTIHKTTSGASSVEINE